MQIRHRWRQIANENGPLFVEMSEKFEVILVSDSSGEKAIVSYDPHTGNQLNVYKHASVAPHTLQVLQDSYILAADLTKPRLHLWPLNSQTPVPDIRFPTPGKVSALACAPNGKFAVLAINEKLFLWQMCNGRRIATLTGHYQMITTIRFNMNGTCFASAAEDGLIFIWSLAKCTNSKYLGEDSCKPLHTFSKHSRPVKDICFNTSIKRPILYSVSLDKSLKMYDTSTGCILLSLVFSEPLTAVCLDPIENFVFVGTTTGMIKQFNLRDPPRTIDYVATNSNTKMLKIHEAAISCLSVSMEGTMLMSGDDNGKIYIWNVTTGVVMKELFHKGRINNAIFSPAFENYRNNSLIPSLHVGTLQWTSEDKDSLQLHILSEDSSADMVNHEDFITNEEKCSETVDTNLLFEVKKLKQIKRALLKKSIKSIYNRDKKLK